VCSSNYWLFQLTLRVSNTDRFFSLLCVSVHVCPVWTTGCWYLCYLLIGTHAFLFAGVSETLVLNMSTLVWSIVTSVQGRVPLASEV